MPRRKNWRKSVSRREVLGGEVSINGSPVQKQANGSPAIAGKWKSCQMQANGSPVQMQANGSPVQLQANGRPVQVQAMQNWQSNEKTSETNANKKANTSEINVQKRAKIYEKNGREKAKDGKCESSIGGCVETSSNDTCFEIVTESFQPWNAKHIIFGSFHQNNERFSKQSRGFQCTSNALCMLGYSACLDIKNELILDKVLCEGDSLYIKTVDRLKTDGKFIQPLLSLDEIPDDIEIEKRKFIVDKQPIVSGILVDSYVDHGLPSLHSALQSAFVSASSGLLIIGAICSAVLKKDDLYIFFDSHCHGKNGLSSSEGTSVLMSFKSLEDLVAYLYAFYHSLNIDMTLQFDLLPLTIQSHQQKTSCEFGVEHQLEAYFKDQKMRQAKKEKEKLIDKYVPESATRKKKKKRTEYYRLYKRQKRDLCAFKEKEKSSQQVSKRKERQDPSFRTKETKYQLKSKQNIRLKPGVLEKERLSKQVVRKDNVFKSKEMKYQSASKQKIRLRPGILEKERLSKQRVRQDTVFKVKEIEYQRASKQKIRLRPGILEKERLSKQGIRQDTSFKVKEKEYQRASKQNARKKPIVLEQERIKKQQTRQLKRQTNEMFKPDVPNKQHKPNEVYSQDCGSSKNSDRRGCKDIYECIKDFHSSITVGPIFVCTCCHQTWFRKNVSMIKNINISARDIRLYCTKLLSVNKEEWVCHTCLSSIRDGKVPKLSVANGMKWPEKPKELDLHQLEERLIALRIPFMQIRELPRGGQYSLKGNVINVPVDIQPTVSCLPRPMDENFTVAIQLKKKLTYKKVDFKENVRPLKVLTALQWLLHNSDLYKNSGINVANNWFQEVTESSDENVREFLEKSAEHSKAPNDVRCLDHGQNQDENISVQNDRTETDNCESDDGYSEIDANEQVGNVDTLVDDANIESKYDKVYTFAPGEGQHPLSLYQDKDAEYLCFPSIFCGQKPLSNEQRSVPVHYSDIVKWELRSIDRRAAQSVPNIFFKHKKLQMKQISDKVNLAIRRCKNKGKKVTAAEARNPAYLDKLVNLDEGYYIFRQLRNSPPYLEARKKIFLL